MDDIIDTIKFIQRNWQRKDDFRFFKTNYSKFCEKKILMKNDNVFEQQKSELQQLQKQPLTNIAPMNHQIIMNEPAIPVNNFHIQLPTVQNITYNNNLPPHPENIISRPINLPVVSIAPNPVKTENPMLIKPPNVIYTFDSNHQPIGIRCTCKEGETDCLLLRCSVCGFYVHARCVGVARLAPGMNYVCPYCSNRPLRCICNQNDKYDEPIIQCNKCHYWVHKSCSGFTFGPNPQGFLCEKCGSPSYHLPKPFFSENSLCLDMTSSVSDTERIPIISKLPNGEFKDFVEDDLNSTEFPFRETMIRYVDEFTPCLFNYSHEFWKHFTITLSEILHCKKIDVLNAVDELVTSIFYQPIPQSIELPNPNLFISDSIRSSVESESLTRYDTLPPTKPIYITSDMTVCTDAPIENNGFICELYGILCHEDEIDATKGIPRTCFNIPNTKIAISVTGNSVSDEISDIKPETSNNDGEGNSNKDDSKSSLKNTNGRFGNNQAACLIQRSFNFNCIVKLIRLGNDVKVALFGVRAKGPLSEERAFKPQKREKISSGSTFSNDDTMDKMKKALLAIPKGGELFLPLDAEIPYSVPLPIWKEKKGRDRKSATNLTSIEENKENATNDQANENDEQGIATITSSNNSPTKAMQQKKPGPKKRKRKNSSTRRKKPSKSSAANDDDDNDDDNAIDEEDRETNEKGNADAEGGNEGSSENENDNDNDSDIYTNRRNANTKTSNSSANKRRTSKANVSYSRMTKVETRAMRTRAREEFPFGLTLLSAFQEDACPPIPIVIKDQKEIDEENPDPSSIRARLRNPHHKKITF